MKEIEFWCGTPLLEKAYAEMFAKMSEEDREKFLVEECGLLPLEKTGREWVMPSSPGPFPLFGRKQKINEMNDFDTEIRVKSDEELINILCCSQDYQPKYIKLVFKNLMEIRGITSCEDFFKRKCDEELLQYYDNSNKYNEVFIDFVIKELNERNIPYHYFVDERYNYSANEWLFPLANISNPIKQQNEIYEFATKLLSKEKTSKEYVINELINNGIDAENAKMIVNDIITSYKNHEDYGEVGLEILLQIGKILLKLMLGGT